MKGNKWSNARNQTRVHGVKQQKTLQVKYSILYFHNTKNLSADVTAKEIY